MPKKPRENPDGNNLLVRRLLFLRRGGNPLTGKYEFPSLTQERLAEAVAREIIQLLPAHAAVQVRQNQNDLQEPGGIPVFRREDITKIEAGTRYVRDYELVAICRALGWTVEQALSAPKITE